MSVRTAGPRARAVYAGVLVAASSIVVWGMAEASGGPAAAWLVVAWIVLAAVITVCWVDALPAPRGVTVALLVAAVAVPAIAWFTGVQEAMLIAPFGGAALGAVALMLEPPAPVSA